MEVRNSSWQDLHVNRFLGEGLGSVRVSARFSAATLFCCLVKIAAKEKRTKIRKNKRQTGFQEQLSI